MGKSPAKWIKAVLFGKKSSRTNTSKRKEKIGNEKDVVVVSKAAGAGFASHSPPSSHPLPSLHPDFSNVNRNEGKLEIENREAEIFSHDGGVQGCEDTEIQESMPQDVPSDHESSRKEQAAMVMQGAFRGYMARRAYRALKGIIRLQALIRGHLVRRQAVATLTSMLGVVKFQAVVRGRRVRHSDNGLEVQKKCSLLMHLEREGKPTDPVGANLYTRMEKLSANVFIHKLLASSPTPMPLHVFYEYGEPNSVSSWMDRWSAAQFWKPVSQTKKIQDSVSQRRQSNGQNIEPRTCRSKRTRRSNAANVESLSMSLTSEFEKPKRNFRKVSSHPAEPVQENPQIELEKVKRNLRKVHNPKLENSVLSEAENGNPKQSVEKKALGASGHDDLEEQNDTTSETMENETALNLSNLPDTETVSKPSAIKVVSDLSIADQPTAVYNPPVESVGNDTIICGEEAVESKVLTENISIEENISTRNGVLNEDPEIDPQNSCRKASIDVKEERTENGSLNSPKLPSYMAATQSAKAKLRIQGSPRFGQDGIEKSNPVRRHSLPSLTHNKLNSQSPRTQRLVQSGSKGGNKGNRYVPSNGSAKVTQAEWKR